MKYSQLTSKQVRQFGFFENFKEITVSIFSVRLQRLQQISNRKWKHYPIDSVSYSLRYYDVFFVKYFRAVHRHHLYEKNITPRYQNRNPRDRATAVIN